MQLSGKAEKLAPGDIGGVARRNEIETAVLLSILETETNGRGFDSQNRPVILFEPHIFYAELSGQTYKRERAILQGLAYSKWRPGEYPRDSYPRLKLAAEIDEHAAFASVSIGLFQILGRNYTELKNNEYGLTINSPQDLFNVSAESELNQLNLAMSMIKSRGLIGSLQGSDFTKGVSWIPFVKSWNGSGYAANDYHNKCARAYVKHKSYKDYVTAETLNPVYHAGMRGEGVRKLQTDLSTLYFNPGFIDGIYGRDTAAAVGHFQHTHSLKVDEIAGEETLATIENAIKLSKSLGITNEPKLETTDTPSETWITRVIRAMFGN